MKSEERVLEAVGLRAGYGSSVIVKDLDLTVHRGEVVALLGANGAGKSTTLMTLAGDLRSLGGEVRLHGKRTDAPLHRRVRGGLGLIAEQKTVLMGLTVAENLRVNRGDTAYALELFPELKQHLGRQVGLLSGGQQQMLALARTLCRRPSVLLADELSLGLAPTIVDRLLTAIRSCADAGVGVLLVEQHITKALAVADRAMIMRGGEITQTGPAERFRESPEQIWQSYLGR